MSYKILNARRMSTIDWPGCGILDIDCSPFPNVYVPWDGTIVPTPKIQ